MGTDLRVAVLDVDGYDPEQEFSDRAGDPGEGAHAPVACHAFAACTGGSFHRSERTIPAGTTAVVLLIGEDLKACRRALLELRRASKTDGLLRVVRSRLPYARYLQLMAGHKLVFQLDQSAAPGQVAGDALLCRIPCVGGNGTIERLVFPDLCGHGRTTAELVDIAVRLLEHPSEADAAVAQASSLATQQLSFAVLARRLAAFFQKIAPAT
jgi:hypothetical protein